MNSLKKANIQWDCTEAQPKLPVRVEHEYQRFGALNLFAAFDTRTGKVWGQTYERKRQEEYKGKKVQAWAGVAPALCISLSPSALLLDESSRAVVQHSPT